MYKVTNMIKESLKEKDPVMALLVKLLIIDERFIEADALKGIIHIVIGQQLSNLVMAELTKRFDKHFSPITKDHLRQFDASDFKMIGLSNAKSETIKKIIESDIDFEILRTASNDTIYNTLIPIKGIGPWTIDMFIIFVKGDPDYFSIYDGGIKSAINSYYDGFDIEDFKDHFSPYGTYACFYFWESLAHKKLIINQIKIMEEGD